MNADVFDISTEEMSEAERFALLSPEERDTVLQSLSDEQIEQLRYDWRFWGRPDQQWPEELWNLLAFIGGRGSGKSRGASELTREAIKRAGRPLNIGLFAPTPFDARVFMIESKESGLLSVHPPSEMPLYEPAKRQLTWPGGSVATVFTGADPDSGRGPTLDFVWADEPAKWKYLKQVWSNMRMALRGGTDPKAVVSGTPKPVPIIKQIVSGFFPGTVVRNASLYRNRANLAATFVAEMLQVYEGTTIGEQELWGRIIEDTEGALWVRELLDTTRVASAPKMMRVLVGVDPSNAQTMGEAGMGRECGIVVAGRGFDGQGYVLDDRSLHATPARWGMEAALAYLENHADAVVVEMNFGGAVVKAVIKTVLQKLEMIAAGTVQDPYDEEVAERLAAAGGYSPIRIVEVVASRGKKLRADPVVGLYQQRRVHHVGSFPLLEQQQATWVPPENDPDRKGSGYSPDRIDALVWALSSLMFGPAHPAKVHRTARVIDDPLRRRG